MKASRFTAAHQSITFSRRMMLVGSAQAALGGALIARLGWLSVAENEKYSLESESNRVQLIIVPPRRGWIVDRKNKPIAINRSDFRVDIIPEQLEHPTETLRTLTQLLQLTPDDVDRIIKEIKASRGYQPVRECALRPICSGDGAAPRNARRAADARLFPLLPCRTGSGSSCRLRRRRFRQGL